MPLILHFALQGKSTLTPALHHISSGDGFLRVAAYGSWTLSIRANDCTVPLGSYAILLWA